VTSELWLPICTALRTAGYHNALTDFSPREIVSELDLHIVGQDAAKRAVAIALRNRWRRQRLAEGLREEVTPKNILMIGPTGVGKTEIARRLARLAGAPFIKVEATKFTEVGYVGRDVDQIVRDLVEASILLVRERRRKEVRAKAEQRAEERVLDALVGPGAQPATRDSFRRKLRAGELGDKEIELDMADSSPRMPQFEMPGMPPGGGPGIGMVNLSDLFGKAFAERTKRVRTTVDDAHEPLVNEESDRLLDQDGVVREAVTLAEQDGIVFIDEIDKVASRAERGGADVSREGVQRDLLPLIEGTTVSTKHGTVKTDHILFIASGAFHVAKPSDLLPELQGRLPIRVELSPLKREDFRRILTEPQANLIRQYVALLATEGLTVSFEDAAIDAIAEAAQTVNAAVEDIGARRLATILERVVEDLSFRAPDMRGESVTITSAMVQDAVGALARNADLSKFIL
jgi:ATP-dependent HslUV protease ATP-binding subunit HslU